MKKWFYFIPHVIYNFLTIKRKLSISDAYINTIMIFLGFFIFLPLYFIFDIPLVPIGKGTEKLVFGIIGLVFYFGLLTFIFPRKKLETLVFSKSELRIANTIVLTYFIIPLLFFIYILVKVIIQGKPNGA